VLHPETLTATNDQSNLHTNTNQLPNLEGHAVQNLWADTKSIISRQRSRTISTECVIRHARSPSPYVLKKKRVSAFDDSVVALLPMTLSKSLLLFDPSRLQA
jgi:hypothetical protein